jgi:hypothetical protein
MFRPFLTDLDSRADVKGSRDPLGIQVLWTGLGRNVVRNLTTGSVSVRDFTTLLLGYYFVQKVSEAVGAGSELATFLKWEQPTLGREDVDGVWVEVFSVSEAKFEKGAGVEKLGSCSPSGLLLAA